jgi:hypothetical protein
VDIATFYGLDGRGSIPGLSTASRPALRPTQPPILWVPATISPRVKQAGREADHSSSSNGSVSQE